MNTQNNKNFLNSNLESLNQQSIKNSYSIDDINWLLKADPKKNWIPESLVSISHLPVYAGLSEEFKLAFNQYNALGVAEFFIFFEENSLVPSMTQALEAKVDDQLSKALNNFISEEYKHSECFKKLLFTAAPEMYSKEKLEFKFIKISVVGKFFFNLMTSWTRILPAWVWIAIFFEERTLLYSREYIKCKKNNSESIDELFYQAHFFHMLDEVRHVKLDEHMIENFYKTYSISHAKFAAWMARRVIGRSAYPINMIKSCLSQIKKNKPELLPSKLEQQILHEATILPQTKSFTDLNFGENAAPRTRYLMSQFPEFNNFWQKIFTVK